MELGLQGKRVAILAASGADPAHLTAVRDALTGAGAVAEVLNADGGTPGAQAPWRSSDYAAVVIPGGAEHATQLCERPAAVQFVRETMVADRPVAAIGEGVELLLRGDVLAGRSVAADASLRERVESAGGHLASSAVHVDERLITARGSRDLSEFTSRVVRELGNRLDERRVDQMSEQSFPASDPPPMP